MPCDHPSVAEAKNKCSQTGEISGWTKDLLLKRSNQSWVGEFGISIYIFESPIFVIFPHRECVFIFVYKLYLTTIWGCALNSLSCIFCSLLMLCWSHHEPALFSLSAESLPPLPLGTCNSAASFQ